jgi:hypothetical protein
LTLKILEEVLKRITLTVNFQKIGIYAPVKFGRFDFTVFVGVHGVKFIPAFLFDQ